MSLETMVHQCPLKDLIMLMHKADQIYTSCIEEFWTTTKAKNINEEAQIHAKVDGKKVIISEASIRRDLSTIAYAIICLDTNQKFKFSKYILESIVKHLDSGNKFLMYMRFVQVFLNNQLEGTDNYTRIYVIPSHTKKVFGNMKRVGKDLSGKKTPLFPTMMVQAQEEIGEGSAVPTDPHHTPTITQPSISKPQKKQKPRKPKRQDTKKIQPSGPTTNVEDEAFNEENVFKHAIDLLYSAQEITSLKKRVNRLEKKRRSKTHGLKRLYKVGLSARVESSTDKESLGEEDASKQGRISDIDANQDIYLDLQGEEVVVEEVNAASIATSITAATTAVSFDELTLAQALAEIKTSKPKAKRIVMQEPSEDTTTTIIPPIKSQDKDKGIMLQAKKDEQERIVKEKAQQIKEVNLAWDDIQDKVDADYELAQWLQAKETELVEKSTKKDKAKIEQESSSKRVGDELD
nr:hypothetical protein [Tanacetum cinerariifolium]